MSDADCTPGREPRSVAAMVVLFSVTKILRLVETVLFLDQPLRHDGATNLGHYVASLS